MIMMASVHNCMAFLCAYASLFLLQLSVFSVAFSNPHRNSMSNIQQCPTQKTRAFGGRLLTATTTPDEDAVVPSSEKKSPRKEKVVIVGAGWGGLSAAYELSKNSNYDITLVDAAPRVGGLVRDGYRSMTGERKAEAGQHGFWDQYYNIFRLLGDQELDIIDSALSGYAEQGQYSPNGLEAVWPIYRDQIPQLPTGLAQAAYTRFENLPWFDRISAFPLVLAFSEFDDSPQAWERYDQVSFRDLCLKLGVSRRCYDEAFEPMILTGLFAPGAECSAAAALGMAYFFVMANQNAFDVRWCKGNIGEMIFDPWMKKMEKQVTFKTSTKVTGFELYNRPNIENGLQPTTTTISTVKCIDTTTNEELLLEADQVVFAVGAAALNGIVRSSPELSSLPDFRRYANLRGTSVLATRLYLDKHVFTPYTANACWGFDEGVGMTFFNIGVLHGTSTERESSSSSSFSGSILEVDYYSADSLLVMSDQDIVKKVKDDLNTILGPNCMSANVTDAAIVRLSNGVNWYYPGSYRSMPDLQSLSIQNVYFAGDLVRTRHGSWSQEKAFVTGIQAANMIQGKSVNEGVIPLSTDELHVTVGRSLVSAFQSLVGSTMMGIGKDGKRNVPSLFDFLY
jgi:uncharacterized protein with NAD-binding domain and iron-sulfur cluster